MNLLRLIILLTPVTSAVVINCTFRRKTYEAVGEIYECVVHEIPSITSPGTIVTEAKGNHDSGSDTINFMPQGLDKVFPKLILIIIMHSGMKEIHQADLQSLPKLRYISLYDNDITTIEGGLFRHNTELQFIGLQKNKIKDIDLTAFDTLSHLSWLLLKGIQCIDKDASNRAEVVKLIKEVKENFCNPEVLIAELERRHSEKKAMASSQRDENECLQRELERRRELNSGIGHTIECLMEHNPVMLYVIIPWMCVLAVVNMTLVCCWKRVVNELIK